MPRTQDERKAETRSRLVAAAAEVFGREGFHGASTDAVADAADRTSGAVYAHFGGKEGLLLALVDAWENRTAAEITERIGTAATLEERLQSMWSGFARTGDDDAGMLLEHELWLYAARNPVAFDELAKRYRLGRRNLADTYAEWSGGTSAGPEADEDAVLVMALLMGLEMQYRIDPDAVPDSLAVEGLRRLLTNHPVAGTDPNVDNQHDAASRDVEPRRD